MNVRYVLRKGFVLCWAYEKSMLIIEDLFGFD